jgi:hypothetical protein
VAVPTSSRTTRSQLRDGRQGEFAVKKQEKIEHPTAEQVAENKKKWGYG